MIVERIVADDGRHMEIWVNEPKPDVPRRGVVVIASAFGRRMHHYSMLSAHLVANGLVAVRFDPLDHIGLSDGEIFNYTLTGGMRSLELAVRFAASHYPDCRLGVVSSSLSAAIALELAGRVPTVEFLVTIAGVCDVRKTLEQVFSVDYTVVARNELPERVEFEGHWIDIAAFQDDGNGNGWWGLDRTLKSLGRCSASIVAYLGEHDSWVTSVDIETCAAAARPGQVDIVYLAGTTHEVDRNLPVARYVARDLVRRASSALGGEDNEVVVPNHDELLATALFERRLQRASRQGV